MKRILVAEDERSIREFIVINLKRSGFEVVEAENGEEAPELEIGHEQMALYIDSVQNGCILVYMNSASAAPAEEIPSEETFLAAAESILACLTVEK